MKYSILLVEDDLDICNILASQLEEFNFKVSIAHNGKEALDWLTKNGNPSLIISDVKMPILNGFEFIKKYHAQFVDVNKVLIIILSEKKEVEDKIEGLELGVYRYLTKPFQINKVLKTINQLLFEPQHSTIEIIEHYDNFITFKSKNNSDNLNEIFFMINDLINKLQIKNDEKYNISSKLNAFFKHINLYDFSDKEIEINFSYCFTDDVVVLIIETNESKLINELTNYIKNFMIDFDLKKKNNFIKLSKKIKK